MVHRSVPRLCCRALLLALLATVRGVYVILEQPNSSAMRWYPDLVALGNLIRSRVDGRAWKDRFLLGTEDFV